MITNSIPLSFLQTVIQNLLPRVQVLEGYSYMAFRPGKASRTLKRLPRHVNPVSDELVFKWDPAEKEWCLIGLPFDNAFPGKDRPSDNQHKENMRMHGGDIEPKLSNEDFTRIMAEVNPNPESEDSFIARTKQLGNFFEKQSAPKVKHVWKRAKLERKYEAIWQKQFNCVCGCKRVTSATLTGNYKMIYDTKYLLEGETLNNAPECTRLVTPLHVSVDIANNPDRSAVIEILKNNGVLWFDEIANFTKEDFKSLLDKPLHFRRNYKEAKLAINYDRSPVGTLSTNGGKTMSDVGQTPDFMYTATYNSSSANNAQC